MAAKKSNFKLFCYGFFFLVLFNGLLQLFIHTRGRFFELELFGFLFLFLLTLFGFYGYQKPWGEKVFFFVFLLYILNLILLWSISGLLYLVLLFFGLWGFLFSIPKPRSSKQLPKREKPEPKNSEPSVTSGKSSFLKKERVSGREQKKPLPSQPVSISEPPPKRVLSAQELKLSSEEKSKSASSPIESTRESESTGGDKYSSKINALNSLPLVEKHISPGKYVASSQSNLYHEAKCDWAKKIKKERQIWFREKEEAWENGYKRHSCVQ